MVAETVEEGLNRFFPTGGEELKSRIGRLAGLRGRHLDALFPEVLNILSGRGWSVPVLFSDGMPSTLNPAGWCGPECLTPDEDWTFRKLGFSPDGRPVPADPEALKGCTHIPYRFLEDYLSIDRFLCANGTGHGLGRKELSLAALGLEKRLDHLMNLEFSKHIGLDDDFLGCRHLSIPMPGEPGPPGTEGLPPLAVENATTWQTLCHFNKEAGLWSFVGFSSGTTLMNMTGWLVDRCPAGTVPEFFGDVDHAGIDIPFHVAKRFPLVLCSPLYIVLEVACTGLRILDREPFDLDDEHLSWLGDSPAKGVFTGASASGRLPQEAVTLPLLSGNMEMIRAAVTAFRRSLPGE